MLRRTIPNLFDFNQYDKSISLKSLYYLERLQEWKTLFTRGQIKTKLIEGRLGELNESYERSRRANT
ncbi:MAG TPA: hypothetical protein V6C58_21435 [Allocoleopsis sp.]